MLSTVMSSSTFMSARHPCGGAALPFGSNHSEHLRYRKEGGEGDLLRIQPGCFYKNAKLIHSPYSLKRIAAD